MAKYVFVTGGVTSSLGKGITAASIGRLLKARGLHVSILKLDPYINVDPGTMSPYQHGEVFVTDDGAETDLDLGHYERFIDENLTQLSQRHDRPDLPGGHRQGTPRRLSRRHRPGHPPHHQRDQGADRAGRPRRRPGRRHRRGRRDRRRHREPAVPRGDPPDAQGRRPGQRPLHPRDAAAGPRRDRRAQDEADPALGQGAARHRYPARRHRPPLRPPGQRRDPREDRALHATSTSRRSSRPRPPTRSTKCRSCSRRPASGGSSSASSASATRTSSRTSTRGGRSSPGSRPRSRVSRSRSSASTSSCRTPTCPSPRRSATRRGPTASTPRSAGSIRRR